ncbi:hypothetical protein [Dysgonomonas sp. 25]|uniref:hypothetical protein n=1 Tax=Dysgonomonas sp. 25 TaxID=2302933 RepID=UPI0013D1CAB9|nr:hypothetical protein [Dysgonomonas sp. 25]NDV69552.1 hypothetical protein [Dysgonomonas sp. 25]
MLRFYSHYTFIWPDIYLKNVVVELDAENKIQRIFPFEKEIENTEFHSGWLYFIPGGKGFSIPQSAPSTQYQEATAIEYSSTQSYSVYNEDKTRII